MVFNFFSGLNISQKHLWSVQPEEIENFAIIAPISSKGEYPNYILKKGHNFNRVKPFKVKSVDGYAMLLNLRRLKKIDNFNFFDENFFLYLENEDLCKRLKSKF